MDRYSKLLSRTKPQYLFAMAAKMNMVMKIIMTKICSKLLVIRKNQNTRNVIQV